MRSPFADLLKEVARGARGARHLTFTEAREAADAILDHTASSAQIGAFLTAERIKTESAEELLAFSSALRSRCEDTGGQWLSEDGLDIVDPFDGRRKSFLSAIPAGFILRSLGIPVLFHGVLKSLPPKRGTGLYDVLQALNLPLFTGEADSKTVYQHCGSAFVNTEAICPPLGRLRVLREELSMRTLFNTVEKTLNPAGNARVITGMFHQSRHHVLKDFLSHLTHYREILLVVGVEGSGDLFVHRPSVVWKINPRSETAQEFEIDPRAARLNPVVNRLSMTTEEQAQATQTILAGEHHPLRDLVLLNAGVGLWLMGHTPSWTEGVEAAQEAVDGGLVASLLQKWRENSQFFVDRLSSD